MIPRPSTRSPLKKKKSEIPDNAFWRNLLKRCLIERKKRYIGELIDDYFKEIDEEIPVKCP